MITVAFFGKESKATYLSHSTTQLASDLGKEGDDGSSFCSNFARREATPLGSVSADILDDYLAQSVDVILATIVIASGEERSLLRHSCICGLGAF